MRLSRLEIIQYLLLIYKAIEFVFKLEYNISWWIILSPLIFYIGVFILLFVLVIYIMIWNFMTGRKIK